MQMGLHFPLSLRSSSSIVELLLLQKNSPLFPLQNTQHSLRPSMRNDKADFCGRLSFFLSFFLFSRRYLPVSLHPETQVQLKPIEKKPQNRMSHFFTSSQAILTATSNLVLAFLKPLMIHKQLQSGKKKNPHRALRGMIMAFSLGVRRLSG